MYRGNNFLLEVVPQKYDTGGGGESSLHTKCSKHLDLVQYLISFDLFIGCFLRFQNVALPFSCREHAFSVSNIKLNCLYVIPF